uniref:PH domain-containing protein n=1 Tax=Cyclophora tenuis TaxID=216820 RepID=A0A7S1GLU0_CYCTE|mmetsp:Transcript_2308/g.3988  ORF Transcript_2308/g.3988 Transcript_2308/m.3988 type:complete len:232 (+) Transcript_2308:97-792(+)
MSQELRRRKTGNVAPSSPGVVFDDAANSGLRASSMLDASPTLHGEAMKLHLPVLYAICPDFLQGLIQSIWCFSSMRPQWKKRYLILVGGFLYKFASNTSTQPKGSPVAVNAVDVHVVEIMEDDEELRGVTMPSGYEGIVCVSSLRKKQYYALASREDADLWVTSLRERRHETIRRSMGHAANMPYPNAWAHFDSLASSLVKRKERIRKRLQEVSARDMDVAAGSMPRGYFG